MALLFLLAGCSQPARNAGPEAGADASLDDGDDGPASRLLFVQDANFGSAAVQPDGSLLVVLGGIDPETLWFMDRPDRHAGVMDTAEFVTRWSEGADSFADDPPNAALVMHDLMGDRDVYVMELEDPVYDAELMTLKYRATPLAASEAFLTSHEADAEHGSALPAAFLEVDVFIDSLEPLPSEPTPTSGGGGLRSGNPMATPLKIGNTVAIGASPDGPYLGTPLSAYWGLPSNVALSPTIGPDQTWTIGCPMFAFDDRTFSCTSGIDRTVRYGDYVSFRRIGGTPGEMDYRSPMLGIDDHQGNHYWANEYYGSGNDVLRTWKLYDPRDVASTEEILPDDPVVMMDVWDYHDLFLRHPGGALGIQALDTDDWLTPDLASIPTDGDSQWYFRRA